MQLHFRLECTFGQTNPATCISYQLDAKTVDGNRYSIVEQKQLLLIRTFLRQNPDLVNIFSLRPKRTGLHCKAHLELGLVRGAYMQAAAFMYASAAKRNSAQSHLA